MLSNELFAFSTRKLGQTQFHVASRDEDVTQGQPSCEAAYEAAHAHHCGAGELSDQTQTTEADPGGPIMRQKEFGSRHGGMLA